MVTFFEVMFFVPNIWQLVLAILMVQKHYFEKVKLLLYTFDVPIKYDSY